jgi:cytochrome P450
MARDTIIAERPVPPKGRLSFPMLILRMIANPVASWGEDFYEEPAVLYRWLGLQTLYVMDPVLIQRILLDAAESYSKQPLNDDVLGEAIGAGLLNAEGDEWRWQRRLAAPLFRAEEMLAYVPAFASVCALLLKRWKDSGAACHASAVFNTLEYARGRGIGDRGAEDQAVLLKSKQVPLTMRIAPKLPRIVVRPDRLDLEIGEERRRRQASADRSAETGVAIDIKRQAFASIED